MHTVNIHEAKTHLSHLIAQAVKGESFIIAKAGIPQVLVTRVDTQTLKKPQRLGALQGQIQVPDDFDSMGYEAILALFGERQ